MFKKYLEELEFLKLQEEVNTIINPKTNKPYRHDDRMKQLGMIVKKEQEQNNTPIDDIWVSYSSVPRAFLYPQQANKSGKSTPAGVFGYPVKFLLSKKDYSGYAASRPYMVVFKVKNQLRVDQNGVDKEKFQNDLAKLKSFLKPESGKNEIQKLLQSLGDYRDANYGAILEKGGYIYYTLLGNLKLTLLQNHKMSDEELGISIKQIWEKAKTDETNILSGTIAGIGWEPQNKTIDSATSDLKYDPIFSVQWKERFESLPFNITFTTPFQQQILTNPVLSKFKPLVNKPLTPDHVIWFLQATGHSAYMINELIKHIQNFIFLEKYGYSMLLKMGNFYKQKINDFLNKNKIKETTIEDLNFPYKNELINIAKKYNLDLISALKQTDLSELGSPGHFIYKVTRQLAEQWSKPTEKTTRWGDAKHTKFTKWSYLMKELGFSGAADIEGLSRIHGGEPNQGSFFDPTKVKVIGIVNNNKFNDQRPTVMSGEYVPYKNVKNTKRQFDTREEWLQNAVPQLVRKLNRHDILNSKALQSLAALLPEIEKHSNKNSFYYDLQSVNDLKATNPKDKLAINKIKLFNQKFLSPDREDTTDNISNLIGNVLEKLQSGAMHPKTNQALSLLNTLSNNKKQQVYNTVYWGLGGSDADDRVEAVTKMYETIKSEQPRLLNSFWKAMDRLLPGDSEKAQEYISEPNDFKKYPVTGKPTRYERKTNVEQVKQEIIQNRDRYDWEDAKKGLEEKYPNLSKFAFKELEKEPKDFDKYPALGRPTHYETIYTAESIIKQIEDFVDDGTWDNHYKDNYTSRYPNYTKLALDKIEKRPKDFEKYPAKGFPTTKEKGIKYEDLLSLVRQKMKAEKENGTDWEYTKKSYSASYPNYTKRAIEQVEKEFDEIPKDFDKYPALGYPTSHETTYPETFESMKSSYFSGSGDEEWDNYWKKYILPEYKKYYPNFAKKVVQEIEKEKEKESGKEKAPEEDLPYLPLDQAGVN